MTKRQKPSPEDKELNDLLKKYNALSAKEKKELTDRALRDFADSEAKYGKDDPAEGKIVIGKPSEPKK